MVMRGYKEVSWKQAKGMMSEANFLKSLTEMDVDGITGTQVTCSNAMILLRCFFGNDVVTPRLGVIIIRNKMR